MSKRVLRLTESELSDLLQRSSLPDDSIQKVLDVILGKGIRNIQDRRKKDMAIDDTLRKYNLPPESIDSDDIEGEYNIRKPFGSERKQTTTATNVSDSEYLDKVIILLKAYEGFRSKAYKDAVGVWTIGFGSTYVDGRPVKRGDTITVEKAKQQKRNDIDKFKNKIISQIGQDSWDKLDLDTRVVLTSIGYNYGSLPSVLIEPAKSGDKEKLSQIIATNLSKHNRGINAWRRGDEAAILASGESKRAPEYNV